MNIIEVTNETLDELYKGSAFTIEGAGGNLEEWFVGINELLLSEKIGQVDTMYTFKGTLMNEYCGLFGSNAYKDDFTFLCFKLDGLDMSKLAVFKFKLGARWLDDIINNNRKNYNLN